MQLQLLRLLVTHQRLKPLFELLNGHLLTIPVLHCAVNSLRWDEHIAHDVDDAIGRNAVLDRDGGKGVYLNVDITTIAGNVDAKRLVGKKSLEVDLGIGCQPNFNRRHEQETSLTWK